MQALQFKSDTVINHPYHVYDHITRFLKAKGRSSKNTEIKYRRDLERFFQFVRGKELTELTINDLNVMNSEVLDYQEFLSKRYRKNTNINNSITAVKSFYRYLKRNDIHVNVDAISFKENPLPDNSTPRGFLNHGEVKLLANLALQEKHDPVKKSAIINIAYGTGIRAGALLKLKYRDFIQDATNENEYWIETDQLDKGKRIRKSIHASVVQPLLNLKEAYKYHDNDYVFNFSHTTLNNMIKRLVEKAGIDARREITFHSLRKAGADSAHNLTNGNLIAVAAQGNWKSVDVAKKYYLEEHKNIVGMAAFEELDDDVYEKLSREQLIELLKSLNGNIVELKLKRKAMSILEGEK